MAYLNVAQTGRGLGAGRKVIPVPRLIARGKMLGVAGLGACDTSVGCCGPIGRIDTDTGQPITAADCAGFKVCDPSCMYKLANPTCIPGDPAHSDPSCAGSQGGNSIPSPHPMGPWNPSTNYAVGDYVWDTCGQIFRYGGSGIWEFMHDVQIGAGKVGTTGCVGPNGVTSMDPNWLQNALANQPGGLPYSMTPAGQAQFAASAAAGNTPSSVAAATSGAPAGPAGSSVPASGAIQLPSALTQNVQLGGIQLPAWLLAAAAALGVWAFAL